MPSPTLPGSRLHTCHHTLHSRSQTPRPLFYGFLVLLVWMPLPLGGNRPWAWATMELMTFALTAIWLWLFALGRVKISCACIKAWPLIGIWSLWLLYSLGHCIPLPPAVVTLLSPHTAAIHLHTGIVAPSQWIPLSLDPYASKVEWMKSLTYILIFILCLLLVESRKRLDILVWVMVCSATFQAVIGAILLFSRMDHTFYIHNPNALGWASGSFINRNHYANFLVMNLSLGIGLFISRLDFSQESHSRQGRWLSIIGVLLSFKAPLRIFLVIMVIGLILSHSRMGNTSFLASLTLAGGISLLSFRHAGQNNRPLILFLSSILIMDVLLLGSWFGVDKVVDRLRTTDLATEGRIHTGKHTLKMIEDFPLTGIGPGAFRSLHPRYKTTDTAGGDFIYEHADNDYLEIVAEVGLIGFILLGSPVLLTLRSALKTQNNSSDPLRRGLAFACLMGISAMMIHTATDYNLHIPANAATFMVLLAIAWIIHPANPADHEQNVR